MYCRECTVFLIDYLNGVLPAAQQRVFEGHLQLCPPCLTYLESYRTVLVLRDIEELDTDETAAAIGIQVNAVKTRLHRARQALRSLLAPRLPVVCGA